jgi:gliding motility-associated-like protein
MAFAANAQPVIKRICASQSGVNTLFWRTYKDVRCGQQALIIIHARKDAQSPWTKIDSIPESADNTYEHKNAVSYLRGSYYIEYKYPCNGGFSVYSDTVSVDLFAPAILEPDSVSVGEDGKVYIGWKPEFAPDTKSYVVYHTINSNNYPIDTVYGRGSTSIIDSTVGKPGKGPEKYRLAPMDSCNNIAPIGDYHQTIFLSLSSDSCKGEFYLNWTPYIGWTGVDHYQVFASRNGRDNYLLIGTTTGNSFTWAKAITNSVYYFYVRALKQGETSITSSSNRVNHFANFGIPLKYVYITSVTNKNGHAILYFLNSNKQDIGSYRIYRSDVNDQSLEVYSTMIANGTGFDSFYDESSDADSKVYYYRVEAINHCGRPVGTSNISNNIVLHIFAQESTIYLSWNAYKTWMVGVDHYDVYRNMALPDANKWTLIGSANGTTFSDLDTFGEYSKEGICYRVIAIEASGDTLQFAASSLSNTVCHIDPPNVWVPNAFNPGSLVEKDKTFKPIILHIDLQQSDMTIYNAWGEEVYYTGDISIPWDGSYKGAQAPSGVYWYIIQTTGYNHSHKVYKGNVTKLD